MENKCYILTEQNNKLVKRKKMQFHVMNTSGKKMGKEEGKTAASKVCDKY